MLTSLSALSTLTKRYSGAEMFFLAVIVLFSMYLFGTTVQRSLGRKSVLSGASANNPKSANLEERTQEGARIQLQNFHRFEVKGGKPIWQVRAKRAVYLPEEKVTHINDAEVTMHRDKESDILIFSEAARLYMNGERVTHADLEGRVRVEIKNSLTVHAELATYDAGNGVITSPGMVAIEGQGFRVHGARMTLYAATQVVKLSEKVYSYFSPEASVPKGFGSELMPKTDLKKG